MIKFFAGLTACFVVLCAGYGLAARNSSGTMSGINGPYVSGTTISSSVINARLADIESEITDSKSRSGKGDFSAPARTADGSVTAPAFSFTSETTAGLYRAGSADLRMAFNSVNGGKWTSTGSTTYAADGTVALPSLTFFNSTATGLYRIGSNDIGFSVNGSKVSEWDANGFRMGSSLPIGFNVKGTSAAIGFNTYYDGANNIYATTAFAGNLEMDTAGAFRFYTAPSGTAAGTVTLTERLKVTSSGVTIGASGTAISQLQTTTAAGCTTAATLLTGCNTTVTFANAFANTTYKVVCTCNATIVGSPFIANVTPTSTTQATVTTYAITNNAASCLNVCVGWN